MKPDVRFDWPAVAANQWPRNAARPGIADQNVFNYGKMRRDFTYIDDILDGVVAAMERCAGYEIYNLGESRPVRVDELIAAIETALGKKAIIERYPMQPGDVNQTCADIDKARRELGFDPKTTLEAGLKKFVCWLRDSQ